MGLSPTINTITSAILSHPGRPALPLVSTVTGTISSLNHPFFWAAKALENHHSYVRLPRGKANCSWIGECHLYVVVFVSRISVIDYRQPLVDWGGRPNKVISVLLGCVNLGLTFHTISKNNVWSQNWLVNCQCQQGVCEDKIPQIYMPNIQFAAAPKIKHLESRHVPSVYDSRFWWVYHFIPKMFVFV